MAWGQCTIDVYQNAYQTDFAVININYRFSAAGSRTPGGPASRKTGNWSTRPFPFSYTKSVFIVLKPLNFYYKNSPLHCERIFFGQEEKTSLGRPAPFLYWFHRIPFIAAPLQNSTASKDFRGRSNSSSL
jgi:hypothetical protein